MLTTATSASLLAGLRDPANRTVWQGYVDRYRPVLVGWGRRRGFGESDAEDLAQVVLLEFSAAYRDGKYDPQKGRLRSWLFGIAQNQLRNFRRRAGREAVRLSVETEGGSDPLERVEARESPEEAWEQEWRAAVLRQCLEEVRREVQPKTFEAFERFALGGLPAERVAADLGLTPNAVFGAKRRILRRARALLPLMEEIW